MHALKAAGIALNIVVMAAVGASVGACAGGGGGGGGGGPIAPAPSPPIIPPPPIPVPPMPPPAVGPTPSTSSAEYNNQWGLEGIHVDAAWQFENAHGEGVLIGVIDDGMVAPSDPNYAELAGRIDPDSRSINMLPLHSNQTHGAELASIMAGNFNGDLTVGVAYEATILAVRADNGSGSYTSEDLAAAADYAIAQGVDVMNFSFGSSAPSAQVFRDAIQRATQAGIVIVVSAGNSGQGAGQPNYPGLLANDTSVSNGLIIIAGATNPDGSYNGVSNPAGSSALYYMTAPGWEIVVPDYGAPGPLAGYQQCWPIPAACTGLVEIQGTSYASPHVAAAAALLMSAFPGLTPQQVVSILLQSTDDTGAAGVDSVTGRGRLNLERAFQPVGSVSAPLLAGAPEVTSFTAMGAVGAAFGDGFTDDPGEWRMAGFDSYGRTYALDVGLNWRRAAPGPALSAQAPALWRAARSEAGAVMQFAPAEDVAPESVRLQIERADLEQASVRIDTALATGLTLSFASNNADTRMIESADAVGHLAYVQAERSVRLTQQVSQHVRVSVVSENGEGRVGLNGTRDARSAQAMEAAFTFDFGAIGATYGRIGEGQGALGFVWADAFGETPGGEMHFAGVGGHLDPAPRWRFKFNAELGAAEIPAGWLSFEGPVRTSSFALEARYKATPLGAAGEGAFHVSLTQPLRVETGALRVSLPSATRYGRESLSYEDRLIDVTPSGRELRIGLGYRYVDSETVSAFGEALYVLEPGHARAAEPDTMVRVGLRIRR